MPAVRRILLALVALGAACVDVPLDLVIPKVGSVSVLQGNNQVTTVGSDAIPPQLLVLGRDSTPLAGVEVRYTLKTAANGGSIFPAVVRTDSLGIAQPAQFTVASTPGTDTLVAVVVGIATYTFVVTVTPPCAATAGTLAPGDSVAGAVSTIGCLTTGGRRANGYALQGNPVGQPINAVMSITGATYRGRLDLQRNGVSVGSTSADTATAVPNRARMTVFLPATNPGTLLAMADSAGKTGPYTITLAGNPQLRACDRNVFIAPGASTLQDSVTAVGCTVTDNTGSVYYAHRYNIRLAPGQRIVVRMQASQIDPFLLIADAAGNVLSTDNSGTTSSVALQFTAPVAGTYGIIAVSARAPRTIGGPYALSVDP